MKKTPTYKEQFDKITRAYIANELEPYQDCACFIGNLLEGGIWSMCRPDFGKVGRLPIIQEHEYIEGLNFIREMSNGLYSPQDIMNMEKNFLEVINSNTTTNDSIGGINHKRHRNFENALFLAMESTLEMLKKIHEDSGEIVDPPSVPFTKRQLQIN